MLNPIIMTTKLIMQNLKIDTFIDYITQTHFFTSTSSFYIVDCKTSSLPQPQFRNYTFCFGIKQNVNLSFFDSSETKVSNYSM